jgi:hypothetical protein
MRRSPGSIFSSSTSLVDNGGVFLRTVVFLYKRDFRKSQSREFSHGIEIYGYMNACIVTFFSLLFASSHTTQKGFLAMFFVTDFHYVVDAEFLVRSIRERIGKKLYFSIVLFTCVRCNITRKNNKLILRFKFIKPIEELKDDPPLEIMLPENLDFLEKDIKELHYTAIKFAITCLIIERKNRLQEVNKDSKIPDGLYRKEVTTLFNRISRENCSYLSDYVLRDCYKDCTFSTGIVYIPSNYLHYWNPFEYQDVDCALCYPKEDPHGEGVEIETETEENEQEAVCRTSEDDTEVCEEVEPRGPVTGKRKREEVEVEQEEGKWEEKKKQKDDELQLVTEKLNRALSTVTFLAQENKRMLNSFVRGDLEEELRETICGLQTINSDLSASLEISTSKVTSLASLCEIIRRERDSETERCEELEENNKLLSNKINDYEEDKIRKKREHEAMEHIAQKNMDRLTRLKDFMQTLV